MTLAALTASMTILVAALLWASKTKNRTAEWIIKPLAALTFIAAGYLLGALETTWGTILFVGLLFAALGDVLLIPKGKRTFLFGLVAFLLGHVAYAVAFFVRGVAWSWTLGATVALIAVSVPVLRWLWPHVEKKMQIPVAAYIAVITSMVALALGTFGARGGWCVVIGAIGFYLSDLAVARERFVKHEFLNRLWGLPLYFGAQLVLAASVTE
jgi:uncharacterized membrane protein YhhN